MMLLKTPMPISPRLRQARLDAASQPIFEKTPAQRLCGSPQVGLSEVFPSQILSVSRFSFLGATNGGRKRDLPVSAGPCPPFSTRTHLVPIEVAQEIRGESADAVLRAVECGQIQFVWNVSPKGKRAKVCERRFWIRELVTPEAARKLSVGEMCVVILGEHRPRWRGTEIGQMFLLSRPSVHRLHKCKALSGQIKSGTLWIERAPLEKFLLERLITS